MQDLLTYGNVIAFLSIVAAGTAIFLAYKNQKGAAAIMGGLFVAMAIISQLQSFKSFEAFTIKAQLQDRIEKVDERIEKVDDLIKQLRGLSLLVAKAGYASTGITTMAFGGVQALSYGLTKDFENLLFGLKASPAELDEIRQPYTRAIAFRILAGFLPVANGVYSLGNSTSDERSRGLKLKDPNQILSSQQYQLLSLGNEEDLREMLWRTLPEGMKEGQKASAGEFIEKMVALFRECRDAGGPTPAFLELEHKALNQYPGAAEIAQAIFDGKPIK